MTKKIFVSLLVIVACIQLKAQLFEKNDININAGMGIGFNLYSISVLDIGIPPVTLSGDYGIVDDLGPGVIGVGPVIGFSTFKSDYPLLDGGYKYTSVMFGARGTYHVSFVDNIDTYGGWALYFSTLKTKAYGTFSSTDAPIDAKLGIGLFVGAKYYFTENLAAFAEAGYNITWLTLGVTFKP